MKAKLIVAMLCVMALLGSCTQKKQESGTASTAAEAKATTEQIIEVIDFNADWCPPCRQFAPVFHEAETRWEGKGVKFTSVNVDNNPEMASKFGVQGIPTVVVVKAGTDQTLASNVGYMDAAALDALIGNALTAAQK